ncbi:hypothetical protein CcI49_28470 [Frankia sp. CcI49]|nr:hypothetical protein CcI49_28470 [Frankia sp. CcI49]
MAFTLAGPVRVLHGSVAVFAAGTITADPILCLCTSCGDRYSQDFVNLAAAFFLNPESRAA